MLKPFLEAGQVVGTHGVRGELRVQPLGDGPAFLTRFRTLYLDAGKTPVRVRSVRVHKNIALLSLDGIDSIDDGERLRGRILYFARADAHLPAGRHFIVDLIGMQVLDADSGTCYGTLTDVLETGANDVYEITDAHGKTHLMPAVPEMVAETDIEAARMKIRPIAGIFDDAD